MWPQDLYEINGRQHKTVRPILQANNNLAKIEQKEKTIATTDTKTKKKPANK